MLTCQEINFKTKWSAEVFIVIKKEVSHLERAPRIHFAASKALYLYLFIIAVCEFSWQHSSWYQAMWASGSGIFADGQYYRLLTAVFLHADLAHLASNGPMLLVFGYLLEAYFSLLAFPLLGLLVGVLANAATIACYDPTTRLVGASGMAYGMAGMWLVYYLTFDRKHRFGERLFRCAGFVAVVLMPSTFHEDTSYLAHLFGFAGGLVVAGLSVPYFKNRPDMQVQVIWLEEEKEED